MRDLKEEHRPAASERERKFRDCVAQQTWGKVEFTVLDSHGLDIGDIITIDSEDQKTPLINSGFYRIEHINGNVIMAIHFIEDWFREAVRLAVEKR